MDNAPVDTINSDENPVPSPFSPFDEGSRGGGSSCSSSISSRSSSHKAGGAVDAKSVSWNIPLADEGMELSDSAREP